MKKTYQQPTINVVALSAVLPLAASPTAGVDPSKSVNAGSIESRGYNDWDDED